MKKDNEKIEVLNITRKNNGVIIAMLKWKNEYVVAYNYDKNDISWDNGHYFKEKDEAFKKWLSY